MTAQAPEQLFKVVLLGDSIVGKTTLLHRYIHGSFLYKARLTISADFHNHTLEIEPGVRVKLQIWDTNGHEAFRKMMKLYIHNTDGFLLVFDVTNPQSLENIQKEWIPFVPESSQCVLVGHKSDHKNRCVSQEEAEELAKELGVPYVEASSVTGHNVKEAFETLVRQIYREKKKREPQKEEPGASRSCLLM